MISLVVLLTTIGAASGAVAAAERAASSTVLVPRVLGDTVLTGYARLHRAGLRVSIPAGIEAVLYTQKSVTRVTPSPGRRVAKGSVVTLSLEYPFGAPSIAAPLQTPAYRVPDFTGHLVTEAFEWVKSKTLEFSYRLGPLHAGSARELFGNYRVTKQSPGPGTMLRFGQTIGGVPGVITPLVIRGKQPNRS